MQMLSLAEIKDAVAIVCKKYDVKRAYLYGSYSRGEADEASDVDIRIEKDRNSDKLDSIFKVCTFQLELSALLNKEAQVITTLPAPKNDLNSIFWKNVLNDEVLIYEKK